MTRDLIRTGTLPPDKAQATAERLAEDGGDVTVVEGVGVSVGPFKWREPAAGKLRKQGLGHAHLHQLRALAGLVGPCELCAAPETVP